jgi:hypothetical protein
MKPVPLRTTGKLKRTPVKESGSSIKVNYVSSSLQIIILQIFNKYMIQHTHICVGAQNTEVQACEFRKSCQLQVQAAFFLRKTAGIK